ncbi:MAG: hypothetical protein K9M97_06825 [Akkermansiaceae bacterium]|nr:hypothetical protein [Akkermansiaceae bacterium]
MSNWSPFLHKLGRFMSTCKPKEKLRPSAVVSLPCLDYASVMLSSGIVAACFKNTDPVSSNPNEWRQSLGKAVCFPRIKIVDGNKNLYLSKGFIDSIENYNGVNRLLVKWVENRNLTQERAVENRWLPLVFPIDDVPDVERKKPGSVLARHVQSLETVLGESGLCSLVESSHNSVCLLDTKSRVMSEVKQRIPLSKIGLTSDDLSLVLRDLVRLDQEGGEAMAETYCCRVTSEPENEFQFTIFAGSLRFLRHWDDCASPVRIALLCPSETNYMDAVSFANDLFFQRSNNELKMPDELLRTKPMSIDIQLMYL